MCPLSQKRRRRKPQAEFPCSFLAGKWYARAGVWALVGSTHREQCGGLHREKSREGGVGTLGHQPVTISHMPWSFTTAVLSDP